MKRIFATLLALTLALSLTACGSKSDSGSSAPAETPAETPAESTGSWAPDGPVTMIVSYKAGNGTDQTARILAQYAEKYIGQTIVIDNVDGGSGSIGWSKLADADADGMTSGFLNLPNFNSSIVNELGIYTVDDFKAICNHVTETSIVVVRADEDRFTTLGELGYYDQWLGSSRCIAASAGVSDDVIAFYEAAFKAAMEDPNYLEAASSFMTDYKDAADTAALIEQQQTFTEGLDDAFWGN